MSVTFGHLPGSMFALSLYFMWIHQLKWIGKLRKKEFLQYLDRQISYAQNTKKVFLAMLHTLKHLLQVPGQVQVQIIIFSIKGNEFAIQWAKNQCNGLKNVCARLEMPKKVYHKIFWKGEIYLIKFILGWRRASQTWFKKYRYILLVSKKQISIFTLFSCVTLLCKYS